MGNIDKVNKIRKEKLRELTNKEELFCQHYVALGANKGVGTKAAIKADYSEKSASHQAWSMLKKPEIQARIEVLKKEARKDIVMTRKEVLSRMQAMARREGDYEKCSVKESRIALENVGNYLGMDFTTKKIKIQVDPFLDLTKEEAETFATTGVWPKGKKKPDFAVLGQGILTGESETP